jgi:6-pyruvoyl-tetrahydropterin synthase
MYALEVRDHIMIAHSLAGEFFGPAQKTHGATFVVDVAFFREALDAHNVVVDIGRASETLKAVLAPINYTNLDEAPETRGKLTTTEFLCRYIFDGIAEAARRGDLGPGGDGLAMIRVTLHESHVARAWFEGPVAA